MRGLDLATLEAWAKRAQFMTSFRKLASYILTASFILSNASDLSAEDANPNCREIIKFVDTLAIREISGQRPGAQTTGRILALGARGMTLVRRVWNSGASESKTVKDFYQRFPHADYFLANSSRPLWKEFLTQVAEMDFNSSSPKQISASHFVEIEFTWGGWFMERVAGQRATPAFHDISPDLIDGWKKLGIIDGAGKFNFTISPITIRHNFERITGWSTKVVHPILSHNLRKFEGRQRTQVLKERRTGVLRETVVLDDMIDYLFVLPNLTSPISREIFTAFTRLSAHQHEGETGDPDSLSFLNLIMQDGFLAGSVLYGPAPLTFIPSDEQTGAKMAAAISDIKEMYNVMEQSDDPHSIHLQVRGSWGIRDNPWSRMLFFRIYRSWPVRDLGDHLVRGMAENLWRLFGYGPARRSPMLPSHLAHVRKVLPLMIVAMEGGFASTHAELPPEISRE